MAHKFKLKQLVRVIRGAVPGSGISGRDVWEVVRLLPEDQTGESAYRIRAGDAERAARESDLEEA